MEDQHDPPDSDSASEESNSFTSAIDDLVDDPVLYPPDTRSPDEIAFHEDLKAYDNPEIYGDPNADQFYYFRVINSFLPQYPALVYAQLDNNILADFLMDILYVLTSHDPGFTERLKEDGLANLEEYKRRFEEDEPEQFAALKETSARFFLRHFPKFVIAAYNLTVLSAVTSSGLALWRQEPDEGLSEYETTTRKALEKEIAALRRMIKKTVGTRSSGRPKKIVTTRGLPEIVNQVINTARSIMGDARGEEAVPGLKEIAIALNFPTPEALGKQLKRAYYPWLLSIKPYLVALPPPDNNPM